MTTIERIAKHFPLMLTGSLSAFIEAVYAPCQCGARAYHNLQHLEEMAELFTQVKNEVGWTNPIEVFAALLFHDAVYDPLGRGGQNEIQSAILCRRMAPLLPVLDAERVEELILLTAKHGSVLRDEIDEEARLFLDCDMAILAAPENRFEKYDQQIASEYSALGGMAYSAGRRAFFWKLLSSERIFLSDYFHALFEARARANIGRYLGPLR